MLSAKQHLLDLVEEVSQSRGLTLVACSVSYVINRTIRDETLYQGYSEEQYSEYLEILDTLQVTDLAWFVYFSDDRLNSDGYLYDKDYNFGREASWELSTYEDLPGSLIDWDALETED